MNKELQIWESVLDGAFARSEAVSGGVIHSTIGESSHVYRCEPWEGIFLWANMVSDRHLPFAQKVSWRYATLNYCIRGRCEVGLPDHTFIYMNPGMLCIDSHDPADGYWYPTRSYSGLEFAFNLDFLRAASPAALTAYGDFGAWLEALLAENGGTVLANVTEECQTLIEALFRMLTRAEAATEDYRFRGLELLYRLKNGGVEPLLHTNYVTRGQRQIAAEIERKITEDLARHYTVEELAGEYGVSASAVKQYFEKIYGQPISHYLRDRRMEQAKRLLAETRQSVSKIAAVCGYSHQGKFGQVFREQTGFAPLEYRRLYYQKGEETVSCKSSVKSPQVEAAEF